MLVRSLTGSRGLFRFGILGIRVRGLQEEHDPTESNSLPIEHTRRSYANAVDVRSVGTVEVYHLQLRLFHMKTSVLPRYGRVLDPHMTLAGTTKRPRAVGQDNSCVARDLDSHKIQSECHSSHRPQCREKSARLILAR